jgi:hypothetical protein
VFTEKRLVRKVDVEADTVTTPATGTTGGGCSPILVVVIGIS